MLALGEDAVAIEAWKRVGMPADRIVRLGKDNFWQAAETGPCGPCSEIFLDRGEEHGCGRDDCRPGCECDRYMEFYNLVFMEYDLRPGPSSCRCRARTSTRAWASSAASCLLQDVGSVFDTDGFRLIMDWVERESGVAYGDNPVATKAHRVLADHGRAMSFLIADGVTPSNEGRGYICRRIIRRAVQHGQRIGLEGVYRLGGGRHRADGRRLPGAPRARRRDRARRPARGGALPRDARTRPEGVRRARRQGRDLGRGRVRARDDLRLPDRADAGARRGARPGRRHRPLPRS